MSVSADLLALVGHAMRLFFSHSDEWSLVLLLAVALAGGCWWAATYYSRLWNLGFRTTARHHGLCLFAALCTLIFAIVFASMKYTKQAADLAINRWSAHLVDDRSWSQATFEATYQAVKALGFEDPAQLQQSWEHRRMILITHAESRKKFAAVYANAAVAHFYLDHPFLSKILGPRADLPSEFIDQKVNEFFRLNPGSMFEAQQAVNIAATKIKDGLQARTDRVVSAVRIILAGLFVGVQMLPFSLIGYAAYTDIKITT